MVLHTDRHSRTDRTLRKNTTNDVDCSGACAQKNIKTIHNLSILAYQSNTRMRTNFTVNVPCISESRTEIQIKLNFIFTLLCGTLKSFMKAFKAFIKPFKAPQRGVKIKI